MKNLKALLAIFLCLPFVMVAQDISKEDILSQQRLAEEKRAEEIALELQTPFAEKHHFGITIAINNSNTSTSLNDFGSVGLSDRLNDVRTDNGFGVSLGLLYGYEFTNFLTLRTQAILSTVKNRYIYDLNGEENNIATRETLNVEFPVHIVLENLNKKVSPALVLGARYRYDIAQNTITSNLVGNFTGYDVLLDAGVGVGFKVADFRFKTELLYSRGLVNQIERSDSIELGNALDASFTNQFSLRFLFTL